MPEKRVLLCMGTRPEIIKMAPVYHALRELPIQPLVLHTGQHQEMAWPLYTFFGMEPTFRIRLNRRRASLGHLGALLIDQIDEVFAQCSVDAVLVHGDTSSALMAALAAFYRQTPVGHVEAGLRSHNPMDPFPEEQNRQLISRVARWHFAPTTRSVENLRREGIEADRIHYVGNTVVDAARWGMSHALTQAGARRQDELDRLVRRLDGRRLVLVTAHRRENWGARLRQIAGAVRQLVEDHPELQVVWPLHLNPVVRDEVTAAMRGLLPGAAGRIHLTEPIDYPQMLWLLRHAWLVMTDSGGIQEEAAALHVPVLVLRATTERPEIIDAGGGALIGTEPAAIQAWVSRLLTDEASHQRMTRIDNPYGDGRAGTYIAGILHRELVVDEPVTKTYAA